MFRFYLFLSLYLDMVMHDQAHARVGGDFVDSLNAYLFHLFILVFFIQLKWTILLYIKIQNNGF